MNELKRRLIGRPMHNKRITEEKLTKRKALAVFSSDALSSVAYATEEILLVLAMMGVGASAFVYSVPIAIAIGVLLLIVTFSYREIIHNFPSGGGAYIVAKDHLGKISALTAGAALMIDYTLTVAVSISSGVSALTSAFPIFHDYKVWIAVFLIFILTGMNLRGVRESANMFAYPTYLFVFAILIMIVVGGYRLVTGDMSHLEDVTHPLDVSPLTSFAMVFIVLRAFASGCSALTGVEAISNGVTSFKTPTAKNATITMLIMSVLLGVMFFGITSLAYGFGIGPTESETVVSQIARETFGTGVFYYFIQIVTMLILFLAANTAYNGFPQLTSIMAQDGYLPRSLAARGDRLVFSNGILLLASVAALLVIVFKSDTHALIPLYSVGVFLSFTIGQFGMILFINSQKDKLGNKRWASLVPIVVGCVITGLVSIVTTVAKFTEGAWLIVITIPTLVFIFQKIATHYSDLALQLHIPTEPTVIVRRESKIIIPVSGVSQVVTQSIQYAQSIADDVVAICVCFSKEQELEMRSKWEIVYPHVQLVTVHSPFRSLYTPLLNYVKKVEKQSPGQFITILIPQFFVKKWWHVLLHNQSALMIRSLLLWRKNVVVSTIPFHLEK
ncbi:MAG: APC family permease [Bacilli bacterium]